MKYRHVIMAFPYRVPTPLYETRLIIKKLPVNSVVIMDLARISLRVLYTGEETSDFPGSGVVGQA
jgi:hypothetical protein